MTSASVDEGVGDQRFSQVSDETGRPEVPESLGVCLLHSQKSINTDGGVEGREFDALGEEADPSVPVAGRAHLE